MPERMRTPTCLRTLAGLAIGAALLLPGCSSCSNYEIELRLDRSSAWSGQRAIGVYVLLCDDDYPVPPEFKSKTELEEWHSRDPSGLQKKLEQVKGIQYVNLKTQEAGGAPPRAILEKRDEMKGDPKIFVTANFRTGSNVKKHSTAIDASEAVDCTIAVNITPGSVQQAEVETGD